MPELADFNSYLKKNESAERVIEIIKASYKRFGGLNFEKLVRKKHLRLAKCHKTKNAIPYKISTSGENSDFQRVIRYG
jgi:hypothetical protein